MHNHNRVLVTGGAGYIGSFLVRELLLKQYKVRVLDRLMYGDESLYDIYNHPNFEFVFGDIRDSNVVTKAVDKIDSVVHLAAIVGEDACDRYGDEAVSVNYDATKRLVQECKKNSVRKFIFASTCSVYGKPLSLYAQTKLDAERYILGETANNFAPCILRFATGFGLSPEPRFDLPVNHFVMEGVLKRRIEFFAPEAQRPFVHLYDITEAIKLVLCSHFESVAGEIYNTGSDENTHTMMEIVEMVKNHLGDIEIELIESKRNHRNISPSFSKIREKLSFKANRKVETGIAEMAEALKSGTIRDPERYRN